jgi:hypothetical protein
LRCGTDRTSKPTNSQRGGGALPRAARTGDIPTQQSLDEWTEERTLGLIRRFPLEVSADDALLLASALATKVSWEVPYDLVPSAALGPSSSVAKVLI